MKKKIIAIAAVVLIVVLVCSLAACNNKTMFDGKYTKEASEEQAQDAWSSIRVALGYESDSSISNVASTNKNEIVKGWDGIKFTLDNSGRIYGTYDGDAAELAITAKAEGALLFDQSAMAATGSYSLKMVDGEDTTEGGFSAGIYIKDGAYYDSLTAGDTTLNVKIATDKMSNYIDTTFVAMQSAIAELSSSITDGALENIRSVVRSYPSYKEFVEIYKGVKVYIDDSGDYNRVKFEFSAEFVANMNYQFVICEEFEKLVELGDCSMIIVTDKETNSFQGAKLNYEFNYKYNEDGYDINAVVNSVACIENCTEIKASFPSNLDEYKELKDITEEEVEAFLEAVYSMYF